MGIIISFGIGVVVGIVAMMIFIIAREDKL